MGDAVIRPSRAEAEEAVRILLRYTGYDPAGEELSETPRRYLDWLGEYDVDQPPPRFAAFESDGYDQLVLVRDLAFHSLCAHHLLSFHGTATVAYLPCHSAEGRVIGLSKLARIVHWLSRRLQVQERLTQQIRDEVMRATGSRSVGVILKAEHLCMSIRGVGKPGHLTVTSSLSGDFKDDARTRAEFLQLTTPAS